MAAKNRYWRKRLCKVALYLVTFIVTCLLTWVMYRACQSFSIVRRHWLFLLAAGVIYYGAALIYAHTKKRLKRVVSHIILLQMLPLLAFLFVHLVVVRYGSRYITGKSPKNKYERYFNDLQAEQKRAALKNGVEPFSSRDDFEQQRRSLLKEDKLVSISTNSRYVVRSLQYSVPYVVPKVERLLDDLGDAFQKATQSKVRFIVTSVLRTGEDVQKLQGVNANATSKSCHCYATTIDITYASFDSNTRKLSYSDLRLALAKSLKQLQDKGRCYVKFEQRQMCYHITVR